MTKAEELLNSLSEDEIGLYTANGDTENHIIIGDDRYIIVPDELKRIAVQYDHDVETVTFDCPRYWDDHDMSKMRIYINYLTPDLNEGCYCGENVRVDEVNDRLMHFDWTISGNMTRVEGKIVFLICIRQADAEGNEELHWNSERNEDMYISEGLECGDPIVQRYPDIIAQWENRVKETVKAAMDELAEARDAGEFDGATFTPNVTENGDLTWTNNKGLENPIPVNIHGVSVYVTVTEIRGGHRLTIKDAEGEKSFDVMNGTVDPPQAVIDYMKNYLIIGDTEPNSGPVLWFDTTSS